MTSFKKHTLWYFGVLLCLAVFLIWYAIFAETRNNILTVAFLDVGQGDAIFIEAPNGNQMLIDGGKNARVLRELAAVMPFYDKSIDVVLATHPDQDHIGGLPSVFERFDVSTFVEPGVSGDTSAYKELLRRVELEQGGTVIARRGMKIVLSQGVEFLILFPDRDVSAVETNDGSIIGKLIYGNTSFLFTGDAPQKIENFLVTIDGTVLRSDVLKVGHHGSKTSTAELFLGFVAPKVSVISSGASNSYGHPHEEVLERLKRFETEALRTDTQGTIIITSDGETVGY